MSGGLDATVRETITRMLAQDAFSAAMGMRLIALDVERAVVRMPIRADMLNGFGVAHGGVAFALADTAFAAACNQRGTVTVALENTMRYPAPAMAGDVLTATAERDAGSRRVGYYRVTIINQRDELVGLFTGTCYSTSRPHTTEAQS